MHDIQPHMGFNPGPSYPAGQRRIIVASGLSVTGIDRNIISSNY